MEQGEEPWWKDAPFRWADTEFLVSRSVIGAEVANETHVSLTSSCQNFCQRFLLNNSDSISQGSWICLILAQISEMPWQVFLNQLPCKRSIFSSGANHWVTPQDLDIAMLNSTISSRCLLNHTRDQCSLQLQQHVKATAFHMKVRTRPLYHRQLWPNLIT